MKAFVPHPPLPSHLHSSLIQYADDSLALEAASSADSVAIMGMFEGLNVSGPPSPERSRLSAAQRGGMSVLRELRDEGGSPAGDRTGATPGSPGVTVAWGAAPGAPGGIAPLSPRVGITWGSTDTVGTMGPIAMSMARAAGDSPPDSRHAAAGAVSEKDPPGRDA